KMKVSAVIFVLVIAASCSQTFSGPVGSDLPICCFSYTHHKLPQKKHMKVYFYTTSRWQQPAVVFITRKKHQVCSHPDTDWVKACVNFFGTH
uniref:C-C motif chemokine 5 n=1 Tax=Strix occidentalis caurina TaxID=311401 RepID=A0A8D0KWY9_STROC